MEFIVTNRFNGEEIVINENEMDNYDKRLFDVKPLIPVVKESPLCVIPIIGKKNVNKKIWKFEELDNYKININGNFIRR